MTTISFPGLGIGDFTINPVAFTIPIGNGIKVAWYGIIIVLGMILAFAYCAYRAKQEGISFDDLLDITIFTIIFAVLGARAYYVLTRLEEYSSFGEVIAIWNGGLAIFGGIIAGAITIIVVCRVKKFSSNKIIKMFDSVAPAVMVGQIIGRWGNFCNGEAFGSPTTLPWRMCSDSFANYLSRNGFIDNSVYQQMLSGAVGVHPTFFYESLWNLIGFVAIHFLYKKKKFDGQVLLMYLTWYGFGRMLIEGLRTDSLYIGVFKISQVIGFLCFVVGGILLTLNLVKAYRKEKDSEEYAYSYKKVTAPLSELEVEDLTSDIEQETNEENANEIADENNKSEENNTAEDSKTDI